MIFEYLNLKKLLNEQKYITLSNETFVKNVIGEKQPSVLLFGVSWSGNAEIMSNMMERISKETPKEIYFYKVDIEEEPSIAAFFNIHKVPTILIIKEGEVLELLKGFLPASKIKRKISEIYNLN